MRWWKIIVLALIGWPSTVMAECAGADRLAALAAEDPAAHAAIFERARAVPNGQGLLWRVERAGSPASLLMGTYHDTEVAADPLHPAVIEALEGARITLVEMTKAEQGRMTQRMMTDPDFVFDRSGPGLSASLTEAEREAVDRVLAQRGASLAQIDRMRPLFLLGQLGQPYCAQLEMAAGKPILDNVLMDRSNDEGVPVEGLETYEEVIASIDSIPADILKAGLRDALLNLDRLEDIRRTAIQLYRQGEIGALVEYEIWAGGEADAEENRRLFHAFTAPLVEGRNRAWMRVLLPQMRKGRVFAAFGAMHLIGEAGIVELLRAKGFTVTRVDG